MRGTRITIATAVAIGALGATQLAQAGTPVVQPTGQIIAVLKHSSPSGQIIAVLEKHPDMRKAGGDPK
jgi:hypothetical protein